MEFKQEPTTLRIDLDNIKIVELMFNHKMYTLDAKKVGEALKKLA